MQIRQQVGLLIELGWRMYKSAISTTYHNIKVFSVTCYLKKRNAMNSCHIFQGDFNDYLQRHYKMFNRY